MAMSKKKAEIFGKYSVEKVNILTNPDELSENLRNLQ